MSAIEELKFADDSVIVYFQENGRPFRIIILLFVRFSITVFCFFFLHLSTFFLIFVFSFIFFRDCNIYNLITIPKIGADFQTKYYFRRISSGKYRYRFFFQISDEKACLFFFFFLNFPPYRFYSVFFFHRLPITNYLLIISKYPHLSLWI